MCVGACGTGLQGGAEAGLLVVIRGEVSSANTIEAQIQYFGRQGWPAPGGARWVLLEATSPYYVPVRAHNLQSTHSWVSSITPSFEDYFTRISFNPQTGELSELLLGNPDVVPRGAAVQIPAGRFVFGLAIGPDRDMLLLPLAGLDVQPGGAVSITAFSGVFEFPALPLGEPREPGLVR